MKMENERVDEGRLKVEMEEDLRIEVDKWSVIKESMMGRRIFEVNGKNKKRWEVDMEWMRNL